METRSIAAIGSFRCDGFSFARQAFGEGGKQTVNEAKRNHDLERILSLVAGGVTGAKLDRTPAVYTIHAWYRVIPR